MLFSTVLRIHPFEFWEYVQEDDGIISACSGLSREIEEAVRSFQLHRQGYGGAEAELSISFSTAIRLAEMPPTTAEPTAMHAPTIAIRISNIAPHTG